MSERLRSWLIRRWGGHITFWLWRWRVVLYGFNAMHVAVNVRTRRWGYLCFHPPIHFLGWDWSWYFYASPNGTPWAATYAVGPGIDSADKQLAPVRRAVYGHNFDAYAVGYHGCQFEAEPPNEGGE
jgi:hypothetical protein